VEQREDRRDRTIRYGTSARRVHLRRNHPDGVVDCVCEQSVWFFAKGKSGGCRCRRVQRSLSPKIAGSLCHGGSGYHPCVVERIAGNRLTKAWLSELRGSAPEDIEL
jgi:hypothetical protein